MAKSKYTPELVKAIIAAIEKEGKDEAGWLAGDISHDTYYAYHKRHPEFAEKVAKAKLKYRISRRKSVRDKVKRNVEQYATEGAIETWKSKEVLKDASGKVINVKESTKEITRPAPWAVEKIIGKDDDVISAVKVLVDNELICDERLLAIEKVIDKMTVTVRGIIDGSISPKEID